MIESALAMVVGQLQRIDHPVLLWLTLFGIAALIDLTITVVLARHRAARIDPPTLSSPTKEQAP